MEPCSLRLLPLSGYLCAEMSPQDRAEVMTAVTRFQRYTCARFVPWSENATRLKYGLPDESHVLFDKKRDM